MNDKLPINNKQTLPALVRTDVHPGGRTARQAGALCSSERCPSGRARNVLKKQVRFTNGLPRVHAIHLYSTNYKTRKPFVNFY